MVGIVAGIRTGGIAGTVGDHHLARSAMIEVEQVRIAGLLFVTALIRSRRILLVGAARSMMCPSGCVATTQVIFRHHIIHAAFRSLSLRSLLGDRALSRTLYGCTLANVCIHRSHDDDRNEGSEA